MEFPYPEGSKNKPDTGWIWTQSMHLIELKDAIQQRWYSGIRWKEDAPRSKQMILKELNAIANLRLSAISLKKVLTSRKKSLYSELEERVQYDKDRRKK
tara:strand:+ start:1249 stop:1545 length:297 start_codon:yes stop_codon:yes gene_type:complete